VTRARVRFLQSVAVCSAALLGASTLQAQFIGLNLRSDIGLKSGTQPRPGTYLTLPMYYDNANTTLQDRHGNTIAGGDATDFNLFATPALGVTTKWSVFDATYGFQVMMTLMSTRQALAQTDLSTSEGLGLGDLYVQPLILGWRADWIDSRVGYAFFAPTGTGERSLDMWAHELSAGATLYFDAQQRWHFASTAFYEIHQKKIDLDLRVGDILTIEGALGGSFMNNQGSIGVAYVAQWKMTDDSGDDFPASLPKSKSRVFGLGPEFAVPVFAVGKIAGFFNARYVWEFGGRSTLQSETLVASFTLAKLSRP
jgi:hypothetical protein